jgi:toxin-antitoxin system PIN domain toxin
MILPDVNILIHAYYPDFAGHLVARKWWEETLNGTEPVGKAWAVMLGFIRITTAKEIVGDPHQPGASIQCVEAWLSSPTAQIVSPRPKHAEILFRLIRAVGVAGNLTSDAHLAALAIEYSAVIATTDTDFGRFANLRWFNPLDAQSRQSLSHQELIQIQQAPRRSRPRGQLHSIHSRRNERRDLRR